MPACRLPGLGLSASVRAGVGVRVGDDAGVALARSHELSAGERRHIDDKVGLPHEPGQPRRHTRGVRDAVCEHQPPLGVAVVDLARQAREARDDVVVAQRTRSDSILCEAQHEVERLSAKPDLDGRLERAEQRRRAATVRLHTWHPILWLYREAAGVVHDPLANENHLGRVGGRVWLRAGVELRARLGRGRGLG